MRSSLYHSFCYFFLQFAVRINNAFGAKRYAEAEEVFINNYSVTVVKDLFSENFIISDQERNYIKEKTKKNSMGVIMTWYRIFVHSPSITKILFSFKVSNQTTMGNERKYVIWMKTIEEL